MSNPPPPPPLLIPSNKLPEENQYTRSKSSKSLDDVLSKRKAQSEDTSAVDEGGAEGEVDTSTVDEGGTEGGTEQAILSKPTSTLQKITCKACNYEIFECLYISHITSHSNEILAKWLYLGAERNAKDIWTTNRNAFTHVFAVAEEIPIPITEDTCENQIVVSTKENKVLWVEGKIGEIHRYQIAIADLPGQNVEVFSEIADEIHRVKEEWERVRNATDRKLKMLVHCVQGISRSATVVIAYLIKYKQMTLKEGFDYVREHRSIARPRKEFIEELQKIEKKVFGFENPTLLVEDMPQGSITVNNDLKN